MKKMRRGFTLVELLIVIAVIGILGSMALVAGSDANNIAQASRIVDDFKIISSAMNLYYADNRAKCNDEDFNAETLVEGLAPYMRSTAALITGKKGTADHYLVTVDGNDWWLMYTLKSGGTRIAEILENKAEVEGLKKTAADSDGAKDNHYTKDGTSVYYRVR